MKSRKAHEVVMLNPPTDCWCQSVFLDKNVELIILFDFLM